MKRLFAQRFAGGQPFAIALYLNGQRANFVAAVHGLRQRFAFQQRADYADGKAIARADGVYHVVDFNRGDGTLFTVGGLEPCAVAAGF